jgi:hypothetical protein
MDDRMTPGAIVSFYFGWPTGAVWSNLLASLICALLVWWRLHRQSARQHAVLLAQAARHHLEQLAQAEEHHKALKAHITAAAPRVPQQLPDDIKQAPRKGGDRM